MMFITIFAGDDQMMRTHKMMLTTMPARDESSKSRRVRGQEYLQRHLAFSTVLVPCSQEQNKWLGLCESQFVAVSARDARA